MSATPDPRHKNDFDAACFPGLRQQLAASTEALFGSVAATWTAEERALWQSGLVPRSCPLCGAASRDADLVLTQHGVEVVRCRQCTMVYCSSVSRQRSAVLTFTDVRSSLAFAAHHESPAYRDLSRRKHEYFLARAEAVSPPGPLLDIGCCTGGLMEVARDRHWLPAGIDASEPFAALARSRGFEVRTGIFPDEIAPAPDERYRLVTLLDLLEHLSDPVGALRRLVGPLQGGGVLLIQVPNYDSPLVALQGAACRCWSIGHCSHFTAATLAAAARAAGFDVLGIETVITELDLILGFPRDLVERSIRSVIGAQEPIPATIDPDWLHRHLLGYKLLGLFTPSQRGPAD